MAYSLAIDDRVRDFLFNCSGLSRADRIKLFTLLNDLREHGDNYINDPSLRLSPGSVHFSYEPVLLCESGRVRAIRFVVSDAAAVYGVLQVVYADEP